jgi:hypothetical protein
VCSSDLFAAVDNWLKTGGVQEFGFFPDGKSGYVIAEGDSKDIFGRTFSHYPFIESKVQEIVPYETGKEIMRGVLKAKAEAMKKKSFGYTNLTKTVRAHDVASP